MSLIRRVARPMLASVFVVGGAQTARNPGAVSKKAEPIALPIAQRLPGLPADAETLVRINALTQVGAAVLLSSGRLRRTSSALLFGSLALTTAAGHPFWAESDDTARRQHLLHFLKNLSIGGGLLLSMVDADGAPSLGWRARRRGRRASAAAAAGAVTARQAAVSGRRAAKGALQAGAEAAAAAATRAGEALPAR